jgi:ankyrin repeat protein
MCSPTVATALAAEGKSPLLMLPNELFFEVASHLESFKDLNSLLRASRFLHTLFNAQLYGRAVVASDDAVREEIVTSVLMRYLMASFTLLLDSGLSVDQNVSMEPYSRHEDGMVVEKFDLLRWMCGLVDQERSLPLARLLISRGADVSAKQVREASDTVLHYAVTCKNCGMAELLLAHGADVNATNKRGNTPLHFVRNCEIAELLLAHGADVNATNKCGDTPLQFASNCEIAELLLAHGADVNATNKDGQTPLHFAYFSKSPHNANMANLLIAHGADIEARDKNGFTPLLRASRHFCPDVSGILLAHGADPLARDNRGRNPLHWASFWGDADFASGLLSRGAEVNGADMGGSTPLHWASEASGDRGLPTAGLLLENGADPNAANSVGMPPLHCAISSKNDEVVRLLVARCADVSVLDREDRERMEKICSRRLLNES